MKYCPQCKTSLELRLIDNTERLACPAAQCGFVHWNNPVPVVAGLIRHGDNFILARNAQWPENMFSIITGFLEQGESPETAILRETQEELGVSGAQVTFLGHYALPKFNQLIVAFLVQAEGEICLSEELTDFKCLSAAELAHYDFGKLDVTAQIVSRGLAALRTSENIQ